MSNLEIYDSLLEFGSKLLENPQQLFKPYHLNENTEKIRSIHDQLLTIQQDSSLFPKKIHLHPIYIEKMTDDQIWAQISHNMDLLQKQIDKKINILSKEKISLEKKVKFSSPKTLPIENEPEINSEQMNSENMEEEIVEKHDKNLNKNEEEFDIKDMENFLDEADNGEYDDLQGELYGEVDSKNDEESNIDIGSEEEAKYEDFYGKEGGGIEEEGEEIDDENELENAIFEEAREAELISEPTKKEIKENDEISKLESKLLKDKAWQLKGEVRAIQRPINSLLSEELDFKSGLKINEELNENSEKKMDLESIIKQRILDEAYDDVIEVVYKQNIKENFAELDFGKSKKGLAEIYEDKYKKTVLGTDKEETDQSKIEIQRLFQNICYQLDIMSNLKFVPKPDSLISAKIKVNNNVASIQKEEKVPIFISDKKQKTAEELFNGKNEAIFENKDELEKEEKIQKRRKVKRNLRNRNKEKKRKDKISQLVVKGQSKFEYNQVKKGQMKLKKEISKKNKDSVKFTKSAQFFKNLQENLNEAKKPKFEKPKIPKNLKL